MTSTAGPHRGKPKSSRAVSGANPSGQPTCRGGNKTTIETQGQETLCVWNILKVIERSHKRKHTSSDSCGHWRQEHTGVGPD